MTKYKNSRKKCFRFLMDIVRFPVSKGGGLSVEAIQFFEDMLLAKAPTKRCTCVNCLNAKIQKAVINDSQEVYNKLTKAPTEQGKNNGLVCPDCLVEHCRHCKCEKCSKQGKKVKDGDVFTLYGVPFIARDGVPKGDVWVYKNNGKKVKIKIGLEPNYTDLLKPAPKKVKEIETDDLVHGGLRTDIFLATKINEVIGIVNRSLKNK